MHRLEEILKASQEACRRFIQAEGSKILTLVEKSCQVFRKGGKLLVFGNGGSAADAHTFARLAHCPVSVLTPGAEVTLD